MALLGVDLGTSSVKALAVTVAGRIIGRGTASYPIDRPMPGWAEQSPDAWWQATIASVHMALAEAGEAYEVTAIGLSGQMHGTVLLDEFGGLLTPAVIWPDRRSGPQVEEITKLVGVQRLIEVAGSPLATGFQAATSRWFQEERPGLWARVRHVLTPKDYLRWRLTDDIGSEPSDGSGTLLMDVRRREWSAELLQVSGIERSLLPNVRKSTAVAGGLTEEAARQLGLASGIPVISGAADTPCGLLGAGIVDAGTLLLTISSGGQLVVPAANVETDPSGRLHTFCGALEPSEGQPGWYLMAATLAAGLSLRWLRHNVLAFKGNGAYETMTTLAEQAAPGANGLLFLPYLTGERTPHMDPSARGMFLGLTAEHGQAELIRAVMEGVVLACFDAFQVLVEAGARPQQIVMAGGGAKSVLWRQIVADVFYLPVRAITTGNQAAIGAALLAGGGMGMLEPATTAKEWIQYETAIEPDARANKVYDRLMAIYQSAYYKHRADFVELGSI